MIKKPEARKTKGTEQSSEKMGRRSFLKAGGKIIPALAVLGLALAAPLPARADCGNTCEGGCGSGCGGYCSGGCKDTCQGCKGGCEGCTGTCGGTCKGTSE
jgi:CXXX repeat radical SAM target protein